METFDDVRRRVFALHGDEEYQAGLDVLEEHWQRFPDQEPSLYFWRMCLWSRVGRSERVLELFDEALARGHWWGDGYLADPDLDETRDAPGWAERVAECERRRMVAAGEPQPPPSVVPAGADPVGVLVAFHGWGGAPGRNETEWLPAVDAGWTLVVPHGTTPRSVDARGWDPDRDPARVPGMVEEVLAGLPAAPLVLAGFSMGAGLASRLANEGALPAAGVIGVAPSFHHFGTAWPGSPDLRRVPTYFVVGEMDWSIDTVRELGPVLAAGGWPVHVEEKAATHHEFPVDFPAVLPRALAWCRERAAERP